MTKVTVKGCFTHKFRGFQNFTLFSLLGRSYDPVKNGNEMH